MLNQTEQKSLAANAAVDELFKRGWIFDGMRIGLGTGSTAMPAVHRLGEMLAGGVLKNVFACATSFQTTVECQRLKIPVFSLNAPQIDGELDLAIDGADEITSEKHLTKGGGAALLLEKIVAYNSKRFVVVADASKRAEHLAVKFPLPIEVVPESRRSVEKALASLGATTVLRIGVKKAGPVVTDNGNLILDALWQTAPNPEEMEALLNSIPGVVENGFFTKNIPTAFIADESGKVTEI